MINNEIITALLHSDPWVEYHLRKDLLDESEDSSNVIEARDKMVNHPKVKVLIEELAGWPGIVLSSHKSAGQMYHKLSFLSDLGIKYNDKGMAPVISKIFEHISEEGPFQLPMNIPVHFGGTGNDQHAWALCDAPVIAYSLAKMGLANDERVVKAKNYLVGLGRQNGYPCVVSKELGKFRGPGKKDDPCPYATLIMLKMINLYEADRTSDYAVNSVQSLLNLWEKSKAQHPYMFFMGTDFRKLKAPLVWYDILHVADTLSNFEIARNDNRLREMVELIVQKAGTDGFFTPESVWKAWENWDFGQKKLPSAWLTFMALRIKRRLSNAL